MIKLIKFLTVSTIIGMVFSVLSPMAQARGNFTSSVRFRGGFFRQVQYQNNITSLTQEQSSQLQNTAASVTPAVVSIYGYETPTTTPNQTMQQEIDLPFFHIIITTPTVAQSQIDAGTGFFVDPRGYIVTANHVVANTTANYVVQLSNGSQIPAQVLYRDPTDDIAVIKIDGSNYPTTTLGDSSNIQTGQAVLGSGNALGQSQIITSYGTITALNQAITPDSQDGGGSQTVQNLIQSNMQLYPGDSGGPTFDINGNVIGINDAIAANRSHISFSVPINITKNILKQIIPQ